MTTDSLAGALLVAVLAFLGVGLGAILTVRLTQATEVQAERRRAFGRFAQLDYEHMRDLSKQVASRQDGHADPDGVSDTEEMAELRGLISIIAPGPAAAAATALYEWITAGDASFDMTNPVPDREQWAKAHKAHADRRDAFVREAAKASGLNWIARLLYGL